VVQRYPLDWVQSQLGCCLCPLRLARWWSRLGKLSHSCCLQHLPAATARARGPLLQHNSSSSSSSTVVTGTSMQPGAWQRGCPWTQQQQQLGTRLATLVSALAGATGRQQQLQQAAVLQSLLPQLLLLGVQGLLVQQAVLVVGRPQPYSSSRCSRTHAS
jgi:hypothetical protein